MKVMYRGVRLREHQVDDIIKNGMRFDWSPDSVVKHIFRAINKYNIMDELLKGHLIEARIEEGVAPHRLQLYGTEDKDLADSYSRATPELIYLTLQNGLVDKDEIINYLNKTYGMPYVVTFNIDAEPTYQPEINKMCGNFIPPEFIVSVEPVDLSKPDPLRVRKTGKDESCAIMVGQI